MEPASRSLRSNGVTLGYWEWTGEPESGKPPMVFVHATGFHARMYDRIIAHFPEHRVISLDMRGHGRSEGGPIDHWLTIVDDVAGVFETLGLSSVIGVGHSMGGHVLAQCAADAPERFSKLVLFDPVIMAPEFYETGSPLFSGSEPHPAIKRKRDFDSVEAMIERFANRDPYELFERGVFEDYCRFGLAPKPGAEGCELACLPEVEASYYGASRSNRGILEAITRIEAPALVVRAKQTSVMDFKGSPTWEKLAGLIPNGRDLYRPDRTHFHPFEDPDDAAAIIAAAIES
ncbi:MAG: alpha/beta hydrolase [Erythrobacter sp.]|jgi:pimeloyl-ACP methyl ester carboxylesterase|nr:alpha/beta hydrolase [Erythrobacter sp.]